MSQLVRAFGSLWRTPTAWRFTIMGNDSAGKTTLLYKWKLGEIVTTIPTIGFNVESFDRNGVEYTFWDVGGCDQIRPLWRHYLQNSTVLYIHDATDTKPYREESSFEGLVDASNMLKDAGGSYLFIIVNKQDLLPESRRDEIVARLHEKFKGLKKEKSDGMIWTICDVPGFSTKDDKLIWDLVDLIRSTLDDNREKSNVKPESELPASSNHEPSEAELLARIQEEAKNDMDAESFWSAFLAAEIPAFDHRNHLRAGYFVLLEELQKGNDIWEAVDTFIGHLERLKVARSDRFKNTAHWTMTMFWLHHLLLSMFSYKRSKKTNDWPCWTEFQEVLLLSPHLMNSGLWRRYYTKDVIFTPEAKESWTLPDIRPLPDVQTERFADAARTTISTSSATGDQTRFIKFAYDIVKRYMTSDLKRGWLIKEGLSSLQSSTMRIRARDSSIPAYSETQAYFWIQFVHAGLASVYDTSRGVGGGNGFPIPLNRLSYASLAALFDISPDAWKDYYSEKVWTSVAARMSFQTPDRKPLPNIISAPSAARTRLALARQLDQVGMAANLPPIEDLTLAAKVIVEQTKEIEVPVSSQVNTHGQLLFYLFHNLFANGQKDLSGNKAAGTMLRITGSFTQSLTLKSFWTQQVLAATIRYGSEKNGLQTFDDFVNNNLHLVYQELPLCYYSSSVLRSRDAKERYLPPDRRPMRGFITPPGLDTDGWVLP